MTPMYHTRKEVDDMQYHILATPSDVRLHIFQKFKGIPSVQIHEQSLTEEDIGNLQLGGFELVTS